MFLFIISAYFLVNLFFAYVYYSLGAQHISALETDKTDWDNFLHCFYFSTQTLTTLGYGFLSPLTGLSNFVAAIEAMLGLLGFAFATSIIYGRFSKAKSKIISSKNMVISPFQEIKALKFRIANPKKNQLIDMQARLIYSYLDKTDEAVKRRYTQLSLQIDFINLFPLPWTIVHPINEESTLWNKDSKDLKTEEAEFIVILKGYDDTFNQYVHQVFSYRSNEILFNADFQPMFDAGFEKSTTIELDKISDTKNLD